MMEPPDVHVIYGLRFILWCFSLLSGLNINFVKSSLIPINVGDDNLREMANILGCRIEHMPCRYLGLPLMTRKLSYRDWQPVINRIERRSEGCQGRLLSQGDKLVLLQAMFFLSIFRAPKGVLARMETIRRCFFWQGASMAGKTPCLVRWGEICKSKKKGGLGVLNLDMMNRALMSKWCWKWVCNPEAKWMRTF
ncbi:hypothetical protein QJS10_CPA09g01415 [Acorus calamus]|uniref:Uncharacterized protein n=1 Tax=Acorus calamus TaxID=4465 RepID=A0AAV9E654_ACOCL|nr:hypothetical protein QJS10_CPA09g01415 [Acorus calamus]